MSPSDPDTLPASLASDRQVLAALLEFQSTTPGAGLPRLERAQLLAGLEGFADHAVVRLRGLPWTDDERSTWQTVGARLLDSALAQPLMALQPPLTLDGMACAGPLLHDLAALLGQRPRDEADDIDLAVRWWQGARRLGLAVDSDFGNCWQAVEWMALMRHLSLLGRKTSPDSEPGGVGDGWRLQQAIRCSSRYGPLRPLLRLLQPLTGVALKTGYTF